MILKRRGPRRPRRAAEGGRGAPLSPPLYEEAQTFPALRGTYPVMEGAAGALHAGGMRSASIALDRKIEALGVADTLSPFLGAGLGLA